MGNGKTMIESALILLNYNDYQTTQNFLEKTANIEEIDKIIVVDNCSTDNSFDILKNYTNQKTDIIKNSKNEGYAKGNNFGAAYAIKKYNPKYLLIANPDVELNVVSVGKIKNFYKKMYEQEKVGCVSCKMVMIAHTNIPLAWKLQNIRIVYGIILYY